MCKLPHLLRLFNLSVLYSLTVFFQAQKQFNNSFTETRQVIERAFALLKGKFRRLRYLNMSRIDLIPQTIIACCVLHNICIDGLDVDIEDYINDEAIDDMNRENNEELYAERDREGFDKRDNIAQMLHILN